MEPDKTSPSQGTETIIERLMMQRQALSLSQVASLLNLGLNTVYTMARAGRLPAYKLGSTLRCDPVELSRWLRDRALQT